MDGSWLARILDILKVGRERLRQTPPGPPSVYEPTRRRSIIERYGQVVLVTTPGVLGSPPLTQLYLVAEIRRSRAEDIVRAGVPNVPGQKIRAQWRVRKSLLDSLEMKDGDFRPL